MNRVTGRMPTRAERTAAEFERAGRRGLSRRELRRVAGAKFQEVLDELSAEGYIVCPKASQFDRKPWRWTVVPPIKPEPEAVEAAAPAQPVPPQMRLPVVKPTQEPKS